jgi:hypothetical protein
MKKDGRSLDRIMRHIKFNLIIMEKKQTLKVRQEQTEIKMPPKVSKQIAKDIWLEKEPEINDKQEIFYKFTVVSKTSKVINFQVDFTGSEKVAFFNEN